MATTKIGLIGCGKQALKHISGLRRCADVEIVLADKDPALAAELGNREKLTSVDAVEQIFADPTINAVDLCVPTPVHAPLIRRALAADKDYFCEKPLCDNLAEARELRRLTREAGRVGMVGYVYRYAPVFQRARAVLDGADKSGVSPVIGKLAMATMRIGGRGSAALWKHRKNDGGGAVNEMLVHMLDLAVWYFGPIKRAELMAHQVLRPQRLIGGIMETVDAEDFVLARFWTHSNVPLVIEADLVTPAFTQILEVQGDNGSLMASIQPDMPQYVFAVRPAGGYSAGHTDLGCGPVNLFELQMAAFVTAVRDRALEDGDRLTSAVQVMEAVEMLGAAQPAAARS